MSTLSVKPEPSPSASPVSASYPTMRRGSYFEEGSFLSTSSAGSGSGNDSFSHGASFEGMTPSPSPPSGGLHYVPGQSVNYNPHMPGQGRPGFGGHPNDYYSLPPAPHASGLAQSGVQHVSPNGHPLPPSRLDPIVPFPSRLPHLDSPSSPVANSPLSAGLSAASYEREKRHQREADQLMMGAPLEQPYRMGKPPAYLARDGPF